MEITRSLTKQMVTNENAPKNHTRSAVNLPRSGEYFIWIGYQREFRFANI